MRRPRAVKIIAAVVLTPVLAFVAFGALIDYLEWSAERKARAFCDEIAIGSDVSVAIAKANDAHLLQGPHEKPFRGQTFYFPAFMFSWGLCEVSVSSDGKVTDKSSSFLRD